MRKKLLRRTIFIFIVLLLGWGATYLIANIEPDTKPSLEKVKKTTGTPIRSASGESDARGQQSVSSQNSKQTASLPNTVPNIAPNLCFSADSRISYAI